VHIPDEQQAQANARLIAAAPDLYEALEEMADIVDRLTFSNIRVRRQYVNRRESVERARAALAKADGDPK
jgi:hypothetical protein